MDLKGRHFLKLLDYTPEEIGYLLELAAKLKQDKKNGIRHRYCEGKISRLFLRRPAHAPAARLRWRRTTWARR